MENDCSSDVTSPVGNQHIRTMTVRPRQHNNQRRNIDYTVRRKFLFNIMLLNVIYKWQNDIPLYK